MTDGATRTEGTAAIPQPRVGAGSADLVTDTQDTGELRDLLARARERLAFYETFDRIIGENIKRSGELMLETIQLREQADASSREAARAKAELDARIQAERARHQTLLKELSGELDQLSGQIEQFRTRLQGTIDAIEGLAPTGTTEPDAHTSAVETEAGGVPITPVASTTPTSTTTPAPAPVTRSIDALFHGIPDPGTALRLQRLLADLDIVSAVEAREFAEGVLRLQVTATRALTAADFAAWTSGPALNVTREQPNVIEVRLGHP